MNFFAHASVSTHFAADPALALGAMLPDLASLLGLKPPPAKCARIREGYRLHHATDYHFHELPLFRLACSTQRRRLAALGLPRGPAMAVAHVGLELLLDDVLSLDAPSAELFRETVAAAAAGQFAQHLEWPLRDHADRFQELCARLMTLQQPGGAVSSSLLAERICRTFLRRPRLAIRSEWQESLVAWVRTVRTEGTGIFCSLTEQVVETLCDELDVRPSRTLDSVQFRRAWAPNL